MTPSSAPHDRVNRHTARARLERVFWTAIGIAGVVFGVLLYPGTAGIQGQSPQLIDWFAQFLVFVAVVMPVLLGVFTWFVPRQVMRAFAGGTVMLFLASMALFPYAMMNDHLLDHQVPWFQGIHALHAMIAGVVWQNRLVWLYAIAQGPIIGWAQLMVRPDSGRASLLDAVGSSEFAVILLAATIAVMKAADRQDRASELAREQASRGAATRTREREETRINAMVHDDIMSVLLTASRENPPATLPDQARVALSSIATLEIEDAAAREYDTEEFLAAVQEVVYALSPDTELEQEAVAATSVPADVVSAITDALAEALRNSIRHAGPNGSTVHRTVTAAAEPHGVTVAVTDNGRGFNPRQVASRRLGIRLSIVDRMELVDGGSASVRSRPGGGTTVVLTWVRPS